MRTAVTVSLLACGIVALPAVCVGDERDELNREFQTVVSPFLRTYCTECHGREEPEAEFDLSPYTSLDSVAAEMGHWEIALQRLRAAEMPPEDAERFPDSELRQRVVSWIDRLRRDEAERNTGDPGPVLARRLSNAEYDYSIQDLTGVDIRPTREFPVDPANKAGFDNSGESLTMSPALLDKYLAAARRVAEHLVFLPDGLDFAPYPVVIYTDRDKFCTQRIVDFYKQQPTDYADYFLAAWRYRHRTKLGMPEVTLEGIAQKDGVSVKYLEAVWAILTDSQTDAGPIVELRERWNLLPLPADSTERNPNAEERRGTHEVENPQEVRAACEQLREWLVEKRKQFIPRPANFLSGD